MRCFPSIILLALACFLEIHSPVAAEDWLRFRGTGGQGIAQGEAPIKWNASDNVVWKCPLPGAGSSSPIVVGDRVIVTCYSGATGENASRQVVCVDAKTGQQLWAHSVSAPNVEDDYNGFLTEHGYASGSPVSDGTNVYAFFGKAGVIALTLDGEKLWQRNVGTMSSNRRWGSGSSVVLADDILIVNAAEEARAILGLNKLDGSTVWKAESDLLELCFATPVIVNGAEDVSEAVIAMPGEAWGINTQTGKLRWYYETGTGGNVSPSVVVGDDAFYTFGGYPQQQSIAIRRGGRKDITQSHRLWESRDSSYVATPLYHDGHLYWVSDRGQAFVMDAKTGEVVTRNRLSGLRDGGRPVYASPVLAGEHLYVVTRRSGTLVFTATPEMKQVALNEPLDESQFNATPAIVNGKIYLRSDTALYCVQ
ncbi:outer membrane protein assembly factor BamB family protein [Stieleria varia]|uniref:Outer membrane biogenesis protein BamB n=1 Tax=Stieleria varia TaxID=2528005 RepID=A0A5C6AUU1_9BACT|nr:PQQ-binding-like beta-propeller repeat protein [Stieleria varia]TWU02969.1 outer membrane biogenesis protein BamB [Stieleria varia]